MNKYETVFISDPDLQEQKRNDLFDKVRNIIAKENGTILNFDEWGNKRLAYEIYKKNRGHYVCVTYCGTGDLVNELERNFRLTDQVLKFMTVLLTKDVDPEEMQTEEAEEVEEKPEESKEKEKASDDSQEATETKDDSEKEEHPSQEEA